MNDDATPGGGQVPPGGGWAPGWEPPTPPRPRRPVALAIAAVVGLVLASAGIGAAVGVAVGDRSPSSGSTIGGAGNPQASPALPGGADGTGSDGRAPSTPAPGSGALDAPAIAAKVAPATVDITTRLAQLGEAAGTGMVITPDGEVLTNNHVIRDATEIRVQIGGRGVPRPAHVIGYDVADDVALVKIDGVSGLPTVTFGSPPSVGDPVVALGNALGRGGTPTVTPGTVAALDQTIRAGDRGDAETLHGMIQIDAPIQPGDSGGPLVNARAQVVGMNTAADVAGFGFGSGGRTTGTTGFAIPASAARTIARQIESGRSGGSIRLAGQRPFLGVNVADVGGTDDGSGAPVRAGALVAGVQRGSPAASVGIRANDVIVSLGGTTVGSAADLEAAILAHRPSDKVAVGWVDGSGGHHRATVTLASGPPL